MSQQSASSTVANAGGSFPASTRRQPKVDPSATRSNREDWGDDGKIIQILVDPVSKLGAAVDLFGPPATVFLSMPKESGLEL